MVHESLPPATTDGYAILAAPFALQPYSARPCERAQTLLDANDFWSTHFVSRSPLHHDDFQCADSRHDLAER